ncbi:MAG: endonuclease/exonuclease/phosphatase family protein [Pseudomonadota bacterium]|nr:endonuclease/exonuclease/phosphatase family protein [Pseudomonadota bacterium]
MTVILPSVQNDGPAPSAAPAAPLSLLRAGGVLSRLAELTGLVHRPVDHEPIPVVTRGPVAPLRPGVPFTVLCWNIQFAGTRRLKFFYDGGDAVHVPAVDRELGLAGISEELRAADADIVLLQEVDRDSDRTGRVDELGALLERAPYPAFASAPCHRSRFVPVPTRAPLGRVDMHVAMLAKVPLESAIRIQLPLLREPRWRRAFNLKRCLLWAQVPIDGWERPLHVAVTHLAAFSRGDGTLGRQVAVLSQWMEDRERAGDPFVLGGDLNLLPPGDDPLRLGADAIEYGDRPNPIEVLIPRFRTVIPPSELRDSDNATYLPWGAVVADRMLDYLFVSDGIEVVEAGPVSRREPVSDHHPLRATLCLVRPPGTGAARSPVLASAPGEPASRRGPGEVP